MSTWKRISTSVVKKIEDDWNRKKNNNIKHLRYVKMNETDHYLLVEKKEKEHALCHTYNSREEKK